MKNESVKKITGIAALIAIEIIFQVIGNFITIAPGVSLNISLIPVAVGAILFGPWAGALLGLVNGVVVLFSGATQLYFFPFAPLGTIVTCLSKCTLAGLLSGIVFKLISKKNFLIGAIVASLVVPVVNTGIFVLCAFTIISKAIEAMNGNNVNVIKFVFLGLIGWNFLLEFLITTLLSPTIAKVTTIVTKEEE